MVFCSQGEDFQGKAQTHRLNGQPDICQWQQKGSKPGRIPGATRKVMTTDRLVAGPSCPEWPLTVTWPLPPTHHLPSHSGDRIGSGSESLCVVTTIVLPTTVGRLPMNFLEGVTIFPGVLRIVL